VNAALHRDRQGLEVGLAVLLDTSSRRPNCISTSCRGIPGHPSPLGNSLQPSSARGLGDARVSQPLGQLCL